MEHFSTRVEYEIVEHIASGGMGTVYKAKQKGVEGFEKVVAVKTLLPEQSSREEFVAFIAEAKLVANLIHENIVQIYQLSKIDQTYCFILEYIKGISLHDLYVHHAQQGGKLPPELAVYIASRVARGLAYAHDQRDQHGNLQHIVHCDVCPQNILITTEGLPKITDFGIARASSLLTRQGITGKFHFMAPEQARLGEVDLRADIYSLGIILFLGLAGRPTREIHDDVTDAVQEAASGHVPWEYLKVDADLELLLRKMLAPDPQDRYGDTNVLARDLEYYIYKDGYGPTIVTLEKHLRTHFPHLYADSGAEAPSLQPVPTVVIDKTQLVR